MRSAPLTSLLAEIKVQGLAFQKFKLNLKKPLCQDDTEEHPKPIFHRNANSFTLGSHVGGLDQRFHVTYTNMSVSKTLADPTLGTQGLSLPCFLAFSG